MNASPKLVGLHLSAYNWPFLRTCDAKPTELQHIHIVYVLTDMSHTCATLHTVSFGLIILALWLHLPRRGTLNKNIELIKYAHKEPKDQSESSRCNVDCGKTQIGKILKSKDSQLSMYESKASGSRVNTTMAQHPSEFVEVNKAMYKWYTLACS